MTSDFQLPRGSLFGIESSQIDQPYEFMVSGDNGSNFYMHPFYSAMIQFQCLVLFFCHQGVIFLLRT
jgi:hypothetical protein